MLVEVPSVRALDERLLGKGLAPSASEGLGLQAAASEPLKRREACHRRPVTPDTI